MSTPSSFNPSGLIEFEAIEPAALAAQAQAQQTVDDGIDRDPLSINFGHQKKRRTASIERVLSGPAIDWLVSFPMELRPKSLCDKFPFVANRLADQWKDRDSALQSLQVLAADGRWGTVGFPIVVQAELQRLLQVLGRH